MHKTVLITQTVPRRPPGRNIGVNIFGSDDAQETGSLLIIASFVELHDIHVFEIEGQRTLGAVDLDTNGILPAPRETRCFESSDRSSRKARQEQGRVINGDWTTFGTSLAGKTTMRYRYGALINEGFNHAGNTGDRLPRHVLGEVNYVGSNSTQGAGAGLFFIEPPGKRRVFVSQPVL